MVGVLAGVVPQHRALIGHLVDVRLSHRHVQMERVRVVEWHHRGGVLAYRGDGVRILVPVDRELIRNVLVVVGLIEHLHVRHRIVDAVRGDRVREPHRVTTTARTRTDHRMVHHRIRAHTLFDLLDRGGRRHIHNTERLGGLPVRGIHRGLHMALLGHLHIEPVRAGRPRLPTEISRRELGAARIALRGDLHALRHDLRAHVLVAVEMHDDVRVHLLRVPPGLGGVDGVAHLAGAACFQILGRVHIRGDRQLIIHHRRRRLVLIEHDDGDAGVVVDVAFHDLVHTIRRIIPEGI